MKKILSIVLALAVICGLAITAWAATVTVEPDKDIIEAGEKVTVTVSLDKGFTLDDKVTSFGFEVYHEDGLFTCSAEDIAPSAAYAEIANNVEYSARDCMATIGAFVISKNVYLEMPTGVVGTVTLTAAESIDAKTLETELELYYYVCDKDGIDLADETVKASITICAKHDWVLDEENSKEANCTETGLNVYDCDLCGAHKEDVLDALGHEYSDEWSIKTDYIFDENEEYILEIVDHYGCWRCEDIKYSVSTYIINMNDAGELLTTKTCEIPAGESAYYSAGSIPGTTLLIYGENVSATLYIPGNWWLGTDPQYIEYKAVNGVVSVPIGFDSFLWINNNGTTAATYDLALDIPEGHPNNPVVFEEGENVIDVPADFVMDYYGWFTAECDGEVTITVTGDNWYLSGYYAGDPDSYEDDAYPGGYGSSGDENTWTITMKTGEKLRLALNTLDSEWNYPGGKLTVTITTNYTHEGYIVATEAKAPTCTEAGNIAYWHCTNCDAIYADEALTKEITKEETVVAATGHTYGEWTVTKAPTCTEKGEEKHTCHCGHSETREVAATGHTYGEWTVVTAPTCTEAGEQKHVCHCGHEETEAIAATGHTYGEWIEVKAPTCTTEGEKKHVCHCGHEESEVVAALGHTYGEDGVCTVCGDNPKAGDTGISLAVAAAIISALSIVALPMVKKHF